MTSGHRSVRRDQSPRRATTSGRLTQEDSCGSVLNCTVAGEIEVLKRARRLLARGWCPRQAWADSSGNHCADPADAVAWSLWPAIRQCDPDGRDAQAARRLVAKRIGPNFSAWEEHPFRTHAEVLALLDSITGNEPRRRGPYVTPYPRSSP